jgi:GTPase SAR1 family protein
MFDVTDAKTFKNIQEWNKEIDNRTGNQLCRILVANKIDLVEEKVKER